MKSVRFAVFADLHYKKGMYPSSVADLESIFDRAHQSGAAFVLSAGDLCNDYQRSPEILNAYLQNRYHLPVYGVYGNHELETSGNDMANVTPKLTNRNVAWGTSDGLPGNGSVAYYYFDTGDFRFVCLDTNYSIDPVTGKYVHNLPASYGPPSGTSFGNAMGPLQLKWLEDALTDAAHQRKQCVVLSHFGYSDLWWAPPLAKDVRAIFAKVNRLRPQTVLLAINGHEHTDHCEVRDGVIYFDVNTVRNTLWVENGKAYDHYGERTYPYSDYDAEGKEISRRDRPIREMSMAKNTWFSSDPLSAIVTVWENGTVQIEGTESSWLYGIAPDQALCRAHRGPRISSACFGVKPDTSAVPAEGNSPEDNL